MTKKLSKLRAGRRTVMIAVSSLVLIAAGLGSGFGASAVTCVSTTDCQAQINSLDSQNSSAQDALNTLLMQASSFQDAINQLQAQINVLQAQIASSKAQQADVEAKIVAAQNQVIQQKAILANDLKALYIGGQMTAQEMLATSSSLSDYVDKQEAYNAIQGKIQDTLKQIADLQLQLKNQKAQIDQLLTSQNAQQAELAAAQSKQSSMLNYNQSQQATFNAQIKSNSTKVAQLRAQQAALIQAGTRNVLIPSKSGGSGGACDNGYGNGTYPMPWCNAPQDTIATIPGHSSLINRECTSYAYWYFTQVEGHTDFQVYGNANAWLGTSSYPTHSSPKVGGLAVETTGTYGHVAVVQALPGQTYGGTTVPSGYVLVSEMNYDWNGHFRYSLSPLTKFGGYIY